jgi:uncharacterized protein YjbI with pentapeptide repeats
MEKIKKIIVLISNKITTITHVFGILAFVVGALLLIYDVRYLFSFEGGWDYINNIIVEAHGLFFDLLVLGVLISIYERRRHRKEAIERNENLIDDFRGWDEKEATFRIVGAIKRLNKLKVTKINLKNCFLNNAHMGGLNLQGANLHLASFKGALLWTTNFQGAEIICANFENADLRNADFKNASLLTSIFSGAQLTNVNFEGSDLRGANFTGADLRGCNLKNACLKWTSIPVPNADRFEFLPVVFHNVNLNGAIVDSDFFQKMAMGHVQGSEELEERYSISEAGELILK